MDVPWWKRKWVWAVGVAVVLAGAAVGEPEPPVADVAADPVADVAAAELTLSEALCSDLDGGMSLFQAYAQAVEFKAGTGDTSLWSQSDRDRGTMLVTEAVEGDCPAYLGDWKQSGPYQDLYGS